MPKEVKQTSVSPRAFLETQRESLRFWLSFMVDLSKASTLISIPLGLFLLLSYLNTVGSPMLTPDTSTALTLILIVAAYVFISSLLLLSLYAPVFTCYVQLRTRDLIKTQRHIIQSQFRWTFPKIWRRWGVRKHENEFLIFHSASMLVIATFATKVLFKFSNAHWLASVLVATLLGLMVSVLVYKRFGLLPNPRYCESSLSRRFRNLACRRIIVGGLTRSAMAGIWTFSVLEMFSIAWTKLFHLPQKSDAYWAFALCLTLLALYLLLTNARVRIFRLPAAILFVGFALALYFPSFAGSFALRVLGIGGGIPISISVKINAQNATAVTKVGCLIIRSGNELIVRTTDGPKLPTIDECRVHLFAGYENSKANPIPTFEQVEVFPTSQLIQINKLDTSVPK